MYMVKDLIYANRWVNTEDGRIIKFECSLAEVEDNDLHLFEDNSEYIILEQLSVDPPSLVSEEATASAEPVNIEVGGEEPKTAKKKA